ncbi:molybdopterin-binding protein [Variovorax sp. GrIS 2.14]|jgi:molybdopterin-binding protein|uniref:TOBE domain-containing protein n=1 Tax=Variovorax sp. RTB1 TaxID=3048631 RepID=UPI002B2358F2|nr:TOBE domain-containing protein [Variovorax sp. RTB1]
MKISARNALPGKIISIVRGPVTTEVTLEIATGVERDDRDRLSERWPSLLA